MLMKLNVKKNLKEIKQIIKPQYKKKMKKEK